MKNEKANKLLDVTFDRKFLTFLFFSLKHLSYLKIKYCEGTILFYLLSHRTSSSETEGDGR